MRSVFAAALLAVLVIAGCVGLAGCQPNDSLPFASEVDEPHYRRGSQLLRGGRSQEALEAFLKVIDKRGGDAPESHLECGILYLQHIKDPVAAIYHFRKYLGLRPTSPQASRTRELIDTATKEFARTLPAKPYEGQVQLLDLQEAVERLQKENYRLQEQLAQLRGQPAPQRTTATSVRVAADEGGAPEPVDPAEATPEEPDAAPAIPVQAVRPPVVVSPTVVAAPVLRPQASPAVSAPPSVPAGRMHTVQKGDSLYSISRQYYGNGAKVEEIVAANRGVLQDRGTPLKIGMQLKMP